MLNKAVCGIDNSLGGTVIQFPGGIPLLRGIFAEVQNVLYAGPAEGIYTLSIVAYDGNVSVFKCQIFNDQVLSQVRILVLIHQNIRELLPVACQHLGKPAEKNIGIKQQIIKIHSPRPICIFGIQRVNICDAGASRCLVCLTYICILCIGSGRTKVILCLGYPCRYFVYRISFVIELQFLNTAFYADLLSVLS